VLIAEDDFGGFVCEEGDLNADEAGNGDWERIFNCNPAVTYPSLPVANRPTRNQKPPVLNTE
jgi:hypothetical protein